MTFERVSKDMPLNASAIFPSTDPEFITFASRRSVVHSTNGIVACSQPLAAQAGQRILREGGNAADAAVAVAAALNVTEPSSTGIGGDMFCLYYDSKIKKIHALNGSGRASVNSVLERTRNELGLKPEQDGTIPMTSVLAVTTPGAAAGWIDTIENFGSGNLSLEQILAPAIELAKEGFPVSELASTYVGVLKDLRRCQLIYLKWRASENHIRNASQNFGEMLKSDSKAQDGKRAPLPGEIFQNLGLAHTFELLAKHGRTGFYDGPVAEALVKVVQDLGGHLTREDLKIHADTDSEIGEPISLKFKGQRVGNMSADSMTNRTEKVDDEPSKKVDGKPSANTDDDGGIEVWEHPPNGQGIVALMALGILEELECMGKVKVFERNEHNSAEYLHAVIESLRIAFAANWWVADPEIMKVPTKEMISRPYLQERAKLFNPKKAADIIQHGSPAHNRCDTVYFAVTDKFGNGMSFINSIYGGFGSGIIPKGCGFTLHNRGANFSLNKNHPNALAPRKRPYHTIIPAIITNSGDQSLHTVYGVMGGFMQPQGHVQVLLNMLAFKYNPQSALDAPRICIGAGTPEQGKILSRTIFLEEGIGEDVAERLRALGHEVEIVKGYERGLFGRGQVIRCHMEDGRHVYSAGSDPRGDGAAFPV